MANKNYAQEYFTIHNLSGEKNRVSFFFPGKIHQNIKAFCFKFIKYERDERGEIVLDEERNPKVSYSSGWQEWTRDPNTLLAHDEIPDDNGTENDTGQYSIPLDDNLESETRPEEGSTQIIVPSNEGQVVSEDENDNSYNFDCIWDKMLIAIEMMINVEKPDTYLGIHVDDNTNYIANIDKTSDEFTEDYEADEAAHPGMIRHIIELEKDENNNIVLDENGKPIINRKTNFIDHQGRERQVLWHWAGKTTGYDYFSHISFSKDVEISGNIFSLLFGPVRYTREDGEELKGKIKEDDIFDIFGNEIITNVIENSVRTQIDPLAFAGLFADNKTLISAKNLLLNGFIENPDINPYLTYGSFKAMFSGCVNLTEAPELPFIKLGNNCYESMFKNCLSLSQIPELPAKDLKPACYAMMFSGCTNAAQKQNLLLNVEKFERLSCWHMFAMCTKFNNRQRVSANSLFAPGWNKRMGYGCRYGGTNNDNDFIEYI